jgi:hypothetical protein
MHSDPFMKLMKDETPPPQGQATYRADDPRIGPITARPVTRDEPLQGRRKVL